MTRGDVIIQILHEVTGWPKELITGIFIAGLAKYPGKYKFNEEIDESEAESFANSLRKDREGIERWLMTGTHRVVLANMKPQGSA